MSGKSQTGRERDPLPVWTHTSKKPSKVEKSFLTSVQPVHFLAKVVRVNEWKRRLEEKAHAGLVNLYEDLATGHDSPCLNWRCLNRLRTGDTTCEFWLAAESRAHMLQCSLLTDLGRPSRVQRYSSSMHRAMEEDSLMTQYVSRLNKRDLKSGH